MFPAVPGDGPARPRRADARRNRDALLEATRRALAGDAASLTLEGVARDAGVGIGTLYRHFPTKHALVEAVYAAELDELTASAAALLEELEPEAVLREWLSRYARFATTKRGMVEALRAGSTPGALPVAGSRDRLVAALSPILAAGARAGTLRADVEADDAALLLLGVFLATAGDNDTERGARLLDLVVDALRAPAST